MQHRRQSAPIMPPYHAPILPHRKQYYLTGGSTAPILLPSCPNHASTQPLCGHHLLDRRHDLGIIEIIETAPITPKHCPKNVVEHNMYVNKYARKVLPHERQYYKMYLSYASWSYCPNHAPILPLCCLFSEGDIVCLPRNEFNGWS
jgi:hypothetical protein